ncbi:MAG: hypothetical protein AAGG56_01810 [Pseudomonadota bacterium]
MSSFRFEEFTLEKKNEKKDQEKRAEIAAMIEQARSEGYSEGYLAGQAEATENHLADQGRLTSQLVEAIGDAGMTNEAARRHVSATVAPLIEAVAKAIAPSLAQSAMVGEIGRIVSDAVESAPDARPLVYCASELIAPLQRLIDEHELSAQVEEDPGLLPLEAKIFWDQGYDHLRLDTCIDRILEVISSHFSQDNGSLRDERRGYA